MEITANALQTVNAGSNVVFTNTAVASRPPVGLRKFTIEFR